MAPRFTIKQVDLSHRNVALRLPFQFGSAVVTEAREAYVGVLIEGERGTSRGFGAQMMIPRWFDKRAHLSNDDTVVELEETLHAAQSEGIGLSGTVRQLSNTLRAAVRDAIAPDCPALAAGFGPAILEMALIDAACKAFGQPFLRAARFDLFGLVEDAPADIAPQAIEASLAALSPRSSIGVRHTIGYDAPLEASDIVERPADDLPVSLREVIEATGARAFKIKLKGNVEADLARLKRLVGILDPLGPYLATLDANEQYREDDFRELVAAFKNEPAFARLRRSLLFFEQPFARDVALTPREKTFDFGVPIVIDESDDCDDALAQAYALGWAGTSVKSCKGVLRALLNKARTDVRLAEGQSAILSAEDLTCQPGLCWQQDTLMAACVGAHHVERNGHHFAGGMQGASQSEQVAFCAHHPALYRSSPRGPQLRIERGQVDVSSLFGIGFASTPFGVGGLSAPPTDDKAGRPKHLQELSP